MDIYDEQDDLCNFYGVPKTPSTNRVATAIPDEASKTPDGNRNVQNRLSIKTKTSGSPAIFSPSAFSPVVHSQSRSYVTRSKSGEVILKYNCDDSSKWTRSENGGLVWQVQIYDPNNESQILGKDIKYMFQKFRDVALAMNAVVHQLGLIIIEDNDLESFQNLKESTTEEAVYVGRIRCDGKLTAGSILFEGTIESSNGHIVSLDLSNLEQFSLFPGQVVTVGGVNTLGKCVIVKSIFTPRPLPFPRTLTLAKNKGSLSILIAAGPFTPSDSSSYEPFNDLLKKIKEVKPQLCILIGPFIDSSHPLLLTEIGNTKTFEEFFLNKISELCKPELKSTQFVLVSSFKDAHQHPVFPTPPYRLEGLEQMNVIADNVMAVADPSTISVDGVVIGLTSTDILMHLRKNEVSYSSAISSDSMKRLSGHILSQRSYYPLNPPDESVPLDAELWTEYAQMECTPHILVLPSELRHFIKDVDQTVVVNPERLSKGNSGTYARLQIEIPDGARLENISSIADITMGQIIKI